MQKSVFLTSQEIQERVVLKNDLAFAFLTNIPIVPGHTLISPVRQVLNFDELTPKERLAIHELTIKIKDVLKLTFKAEGFNFAWNEGEMAGQSVPHFHLHVIPRTIGDTGILQYDPRKFIYRPGSREAFPEAELKAVAELIKSHLAN